MFSECVTHYITSSPTLFPIFYRDLAVLLKSLRPRFSKQSMHNFLDPFTIFIYLSRNGSYIRLVQSIGWLSNTCRFLRWAKVKFSISVGSIICSSSFSITKPRYLIYLSLQRAAAIRSSTSLLRSRICCWLMPGMLLSISFCDCLVGILVSLITFIPSFESLAE